MSKEYQLRIKDLKFKIVGACVLLLCSFFCFSQNNSPFNCHPEPVEGKHSTFLMLLPVKENNNIHLTLSPLKHEAFFCKMEDKVYSKLNVWITLRAGNDDIYRKLIATP